MRFMLSSEMDINKLIAFNYQLKDLIDIKFDEGLSNASSAGLYMAYVLGKAYKTHMSIIMLCKNKLGEDAFMLARTLFELMVTCKYILADKAGKRLERYMDFDWVTRNQMYDYVSSKDALLQELANKINDSKLGTIENIKQHCIRVKNKWKYGKTGWSDKSIDKMAEEIGRKDAYGTVYRLQCTLGHSNARSMNEYIKENNGEFIIDIEGGNNLVEESLVITFDFFSHIAKEAYELFGWKIEELDNIVNSYIAFMKKVNNSKKL